MPITQEPTPLFTREMNKLLSPAMRRNIPTLYSQEEVDDPIVHVKFFLAASRWTWFITEGRVENEDSDYLMFGYVQGSHEQDDEFGYISLRELSEVHNALGLKVERDLYFSPQPLSKAVPGWKL